jgi:hypothetical protein
MGRWRIIEMDVEEQMVIIVGIPFPKFAGNGAV